MKNKITTMRSRPEISEEEIQQRMSFEKLILDRHQYLKKQQRLGWSRNLALSAGVITLATVIYFAIRPTDEKIEVNNRGAAGQTETSSDLSPITNPPGIDSTAISSLSETPLTGGSKPVSEKQTSKRTPIATNDNNTQVAGRESKTQNEDEPIASASVYHQAEPVSGYPDLYAYFERELTYPQEAVRDSLEGVVTVVFTINAAGKPENILVENSLGTPFDQEVNRVIENMPPWKPASYNGKPMKSKVSIPLTFELKNTKQ
jgi:TonB family protein